MPNKKSSRSRSPLQASAVVLRRLAGDIKHTDPANVICILEDCAEKAESAHQLQVELTTALETIKRLGGVSSEAAIAAAALAKAGQ
jgi:hypothetical protein